MKLLAAVMPALLAASCMAAREGTTCHDRVDECLARCVQRLDPVERVEREVGFGADRRTACERDCHLSCRW